MNFSKLLSALFVSFFIVGCSSVTQTQIKTQSESETVGRIAFPVLGRRITNNADSSIALEVIIKNQKTGETFTSLIEYEETKRVVYIDNLTPGLYLIDEFNEHVYSAAMLRKFEPSVVIEVEAGKTVLSPVYVLMEAAVYPRCNLAIISDDGFWDDYL